MTEFLLLLDEKMKRKVPHGDEMDTDTESKKNDSLDEL